MNRLVIVFIAMLLTLWTAAPAASAQESAVSTMAAITLHLNHYPSGSELRQLEAIDRDAASTEIRTLARALMRMRHTVQPEDAQALRKLAMNESASREARELASILLNIQHHPSSADQQRLQALIQGK